MRRSAHSISVVPLIGATTAQLTDIRRAMDLAVEGQFAFPQMFALRVIPADSGVRSLNILGALNNWSALPVGTPKVLILRTASEGSEPGEFALFDGGGASCAHVSEHFCPLDRTLHVAVAIKTIRDRTSRSALLYVAGAGNKTCGTTQYQLAGPGYPGPDQRQGYGTAGDL